MKKLELHWKIMIGMVLGLLFGFAMTYMDWGKEFVTNWIAPFGTIFIKLLKLIAVPLILASLIKGISDLKDISKFRNIGLRTIGIYIGTTTVAIILGLVLVNVIQPGNGISEETIDKLTSTFANDKGVTSKLEEASRQKESGPLKFVEDMVRDIAHELTQISSISGFKVSSENFESIHNHSAYAEISNNYSALIV